MADLHKNKKVGITWKEFEDEYIKKYYYKGAKEVQKHLPNRTISAIQNRAFVLGIKYLTYNKNYFDVIDTPTKAYWLGFLYADGYVTSKNRWGLELSYVDIEHMKNLIKCLEYSGEIKIRNKNGFDNCFFLINNKHMTNSLIDKGIVRNKTYCLEFPNKNILNPTFYSHFIRGFFDGDGCIYITHKIVKRKDRNNKCYDRISKGISIICKMEGFLDSVLSILEKENIYLHKNLHHQNNLYVIRTSSKNEIQKFYDYIYKDSNQTIRLKRKYLKFNELLTATPDSNVRKKIS